MLCEMAGRKRKLDEWDVSEMEESEGATVHGVFTELSPVKVSRRNASVRFRKRDAVSRVLFYGSALLLFSARSPCCDAAPSRPLRPLNFNVRCTFDVNPTCRF